MYLCIAAMKSCCKDVMEDQDKDAPKPKGIGTWLRRLGVAGVLFFLLKGIAWLFVFWGGAKLIGCS